MILWSDDENSGAAGGAASDTPSEPLTVDVPPGSDSPDEDAPSDVAEHDEGPEARTQTQDAERIETAASKTTRKAPEAPPAAPAGPPLGLYVKAAQLGFTEEEIAACETPAELERALLREERRRGAEQQKNTAVQPGEGFKVDDIPDLSENDYDKALVDGWKSMKTALKQTQGALQELRTERQYEVQREYHNWFEQQIGELGDAGKALFGDKSAPNQQNRAMLWDAIAVMVNSGKAADRNAAFKEMYRAKFGENIAQAERKRITTEAVKREKQFTIPPSQREGREMTGEEKALQTIREHKRKLSGKR